jgi:hypothetical protein
MNQALGEPLLLRMAVIECVHQDAGIDKPMGVSAGMQVSRVRMRLLRTSWLTLAP